MKKKKKRKRKIYCFSAQPPLSKREQKEYDLERKRIAKERAKEDKILLFGLSKKDRVIYQIAKIVAESDSIGEGYSYCEYYGVMNYLADDEYRKVAEVIYEVIYASDNRTSA